MVKILIVSDWNERIEKYEKILLQEKYSYSVLMDENLIYEYINAEEPDIILLDAEIKSLKIKNFVKKIKSVSENSILILLTKNKYEDKEVLKYTNAILANDFSENLIHSVISANLRMKASLDKLSNTNKDLAGSLYRLNALYNTSSQFAGTLDKEKLFDYMIEGFDKTLSFSLAAALSFCTEKQPVLILNSLYEISDELLSSIKLRVIYNYQSLFKDKKLPYDVTEQNLKVQKVVKYPASRFTFTLFQYDNLFAPISLGDNFYGCIEIFKEKPLTTEDAKSFQTIAQQVTLPLKSATLYAEIKETNRKLEQLEKLKSEFISIVSHELRTPLTSIKNSLDILLSGKCFDVTPSSEKFLTMAKRNVTRLSGIINDLLDLSKIEAGKMDFHFKDIDIHTVVDYVTAALSGVAKEKGITISTDKAENIPLIKADSQRLEQVLANLVSNAIKFTPENKNICIKTEFKKADDIIFNSCFEDELKNMKGDYVVVTVEDEGIGIAECDLLRAFDKFAQIENSLSRKSGGTGLGLPIAKQLLEAHNGYIWCDSELEKGSKFHFALPIN